MKTLAIILSVAAIILAFAGGYFIGRTKPIQSVPPQLTLEQVLSIRELHLVKHTYNDLFFLHKKNDKTKAIRAIVHVPVVVTAHLDMKKIQLVRQADSVRQIILPRAIVNAPHYQLENMVIRETRSFQIYVGKDLYPEVGHYIHSLIAERSTTIEAMAITQRIAIQAEEEGKEYIEGLLRSIGRSDIKVLFEGEEQGDDIKTLRLKSTHPHAQQAGLEVIAFGFLPL